MASEGYPVASLLLIAATAQQLSLCTGSVSDPTFEETASQASPPAAAVEAVRAAMQEVVQSAFSGIAGDEISQEDAEVHVDAIQGIVRALDAPHCLSEEAEVNSDSDLAELEEGGLESILKGYRDAVWQALQQHVMQAPTARAASYAHVHMLDILSALSQGGGKAPGAPSNRRWGAWSVPGSDDSAQMGAHSLLLSCTAAMVAPLWPEAGRQLTAADVCDTSAASKLFLALLASAHSELQLTALAELLSSTWRNGDALDPAEPLESVEEETGYTMDTGMHSSAVSGPEAADTIIPGDSNHKGLDPDLAAAQAALAEFEDGWGSEAEDANEDEGLDSARWESREDPGDCWVPGDSSNSDVDCDVCILHNCWAALLIAMAEQHHSGLVVTQLDGAEQGRLLLTESEAHGLACCVWKSAGAHVNVLMSFHIRPSALCTASF